LPYLFEPGRLDDGYHQFHVTPLAPGRRVLERSLRLKPRAKLACGTILQSKQGLAKSLANCLRIAQKFRLFFVQQFSSLMQICTALAGGVQSAHCEWEASVADRRGCELHAASKRRGWPARGPTIAIGLLELGVGFDADFSHVETDVFIFGSRAQTHYGL